MPSPSEPKSPCSVTTADLLDLMNYPLQIPSSPLVMNLGGQGVNDSLTDTTATIESRSVHTGHKFKCLHIVACKYIHTTHTHICIYVENC